jgi:WD40 repeat protein
VDFRGHQDAITTAKFSTDGHRLLSASRDATTRLWDVQTGQLIATLRHEDVVNDAVFSPNGKQLLTISGDQTAQVWTEESTGVELFPMKLHGVTSAAFSPDGAMMALVQSDQDASAIVLVNARARWDEQKNTLTKVRSRIEALSFANTENGLYLLASDSEGNFYEWKAPKGSFDRAFSAQVSGVEKGIFRADGAIFIGDGKHGPTIVWEAKTGRIIGALPHEQLGGDPLAISGDVAVIGLEDGRVLLWNFTQALRPVGILMNDACAWLDLNGGRKFSEFEVATDPLIDEAWRHGDYKRQVCPDRTE